VATEKEIKKAAIEQRIRNAPRSVQGAAWISALLGLMAAVHLVLIGVLKGTLSGMIVALGVLMFLFIIMNAMLLLAGSRLSYLFIALTVLLPSLYLLTSPLYLVELLANRALSISPIRTSVAVIDTIRLVLTMVVVACLLMPVTIRHVWRGSDD
jgi:hypothetical protein